MKHFKTQELVGKQAYQLHGERAIRFLDEKLLTCLSIIREQLNRPITVNNWHIGGLFEQRGLRDNTQEIVRAKTMQGKLYLSAHVLGKAVDFDVKGMSAQEVREWIIDNEDLFPCKIRLEKGVDWVHLDVISEQKNPKVYQF